MALQTQMSLLDGAVVIQFDVSAANVVTALSAVNNSTATVTAEITRPTGQVLTRTLAPGATASVSIAKGKQFTYADDVLADWGLRVSLS